MISKRRQEELFQEGYRLAYHTRTKVKPWQQVYELWRKAAMNGHVKAQFYLGVCYDQGLGVRKDLRESFKWYMKAALNGMMEAQFNIGFFYKKGDLVRVNFKKAVYWYSLAAKQGDTEAQRDLGYCYFYGGRCEQRPIKSGGMV